MTKCVFVFIHYFRYSHAYFANAIQNASVPWGVPLHCDLRPLKTPTGIIRILLVVCLIDNLTPSNRSVKHKWANLNVTFYLFRYRQRHA